MCFCVCSSCLTDSFKKASFCVWLYCRGCYRDRAVPLGPRCARNKWKQGKAVSSLQGGCEGCRGTTRAVWGCGGGCVAEEEEGSWWVVGRRCVERPGRIPHCAFPLPGKQDLWKQSDSQPSTVIIFWFHHIFPPSTKILAISCCLYQTICSSPTALHSLACSRLLQSLIGRVFTLKLLLMKYENDVGLFDRNDIYYDGFRGSRWWDLFLIVASQ